MSDSASDAPSAQPKLDAATSVTFPVRVAAAWSWRLIVIGVVGYVVVQAVARVELVAFSLVLALLLTSVLHPVERTIRRVVRGPRSLATAVTVLLGITVLGLVGWFVTWQITDHSTQLGEQITTFVNKSKNWLQNGPLKLKQTDFDKLTQNISKTVSSHESDLVNGAVATFQTVVDIFEAALLILLSTFFLLRDGDLVWRWVLSLFPRVAHHRLDVAGRAGWHTLGGYMRGTVLIALFHGVSVTIGLLLLNIPLAPALGVLIFLGSFIPLIGLTVTGAFCCAVALLEHGVTAAIVLAILITVLVQVESHLLQPLIMARAVEVHPFAVVVSVLTGSTVAGIAGALIAVPLVAFLNTAIRAVRADSPVPAGSTFPVGERDNTGELVPEGTHSADDD